MKHIHFILFLLFATLSLECASQVPVVSYDSLVTPWSRTIVGLDERDSITTLDYFVLDSLDNWLHKGHCSVFRDSLHRMDSLSMFKKHIDFCLWMDSSYHEELKEYTCWLYTWYSYKDEHTFVGEEHVMTFCDSSDKTCDYNNPLFYIHFTTHNQNTQQDLEIANDSIVYNQFGKIAEKYCNNNKTMSFYKNDTVLWKEIHYYKKNKHFKKDKMSYYSEGLLTMEKTRFNLTTYEYHNNGIIAKIDYYLWNSDEEQFILNERKEYSQDGKLLKIYTIPTDIPSQSNYTYNGRKESQLEIYKMLPLKEEYLYDSVGNLIEERFYSTDYACTRKNPNFLIRQVTYEFDSLRNYTSKHIFKSYRDIGCLNCCYHETLNLVDSHLISPKKIIIEDMDKKVDCCGNEYYIEKIEIPNLHFSFRTRFIYNNNHYFLLEKKLKSCTCVSEYLYYFE